jgi:hypothetical protein
MESFRESCSDSLPFLSGYFYRTVVVTMAVVWIMQMAADQVVDMISVWHSLMAASGAMHMFRLMHGTLMPRCAVFRICLCHGYDMLINMAAVRIVQMTIVQIIDVIVMPDASMTALRAVRMSMIFVLWQVTIRHCRFLIKKD